MIILPLGHEQMEAQRLPYITIGIVILNVAIFLITAVVAPQTDRELMERGEELIGYYFDHLYLDLPQGTFEKFPPEIQAEIEHRKQ